ncbi:MAG: hypothetical protein HQL21_02430 [Candidatus Omnitrophica bacterium]|nr:hypothetical protein [Candidatus Omnitrophota bacterium]
MDLFNTLFKIIIYVCFLSSASWAMADTIKLKNGNSVECKIISQDNKTVKVDFNGISLTYWMDEISSVNDQPIVMKDTGKVLIEPPRKTVAVQTKIVEKPSSNDGVNQQDAGKEIFIQRLDSLFRLSSDVDGMKIKAAGDSLRKFAEDYPRSRFTLDAQALPSLILFMSSVTSMDENTANSCVLSIESLVKKYPNGRRQDEILARSDELGLGFRSKGLFIVPWAQIDVYMRGSLALAFNHYDEALKQFLLLKENVDRDGDGSEDRVWTREIYSILYDVYSKQQKSDLAISVVEEALLKCEDCSWKKEMKNLVSKGSGKKKKRRAK